MYNRIPNLILITLIGFLTTTSTTYGQNTGIYITLEGGPAFPLGAYGSNEGEEAGYAQLGINGTAGVGFRLSPALAFGAKYASTQHSVAEEASLLEETPWKGNFFLAELTGNFPLGNRFAAEANLMGGYALMQFPDGNFSIGDVSITNDGGRGTGFGYGAGVGLRYFLDDYISFKLGATYLGARPKLESNGDALNQPVGMINTNFGITLTMD